MAVVNAISYMRPTQLQRALISALIRPCLPNGGRIYMRAPPWLQGVYIYRQALLLPPSVLSTGRKAATRTTVFRPHLWIHAGCGAAANQVATTLSHTITMYRVSPGTGSSGFGMRNIDTWKVRNCTCLKIFFFFFFNL